RRSRLSGLHLVANACQSKPGPCHVVQSLTQLRADAAISRHCSAYSRNFSAEAICCPAMFHHNGIRQNDIRDFMFPKLNLHPCGTKTARQTRSLNDGTANRLTLAHQYSTGKGLLSKGYSSNKLNRCRDPCRAPAARRRGD